MSRLGLNGWPMALANQWSVRLPFIAGTGGQRTYGIHHKRIFSRCAFSANVIVIGFDI